MIYDEEQQAILEAGVGSDTPVWDLTKLYLLVDPDFSRADWGARAEMAACEGGWPARIYPTKLDSRMGWFGYDIFS